MYAPALSCMHADEGQTALNNHTLVAPETVIRCHMKAQYHVNNVPVCLGHSHIHTHILNLCSIASDWQQW